MLTLSRKGVERAECAARGQGLDKEQKAWSGFVKPAELEHDTAVFRAARIEQAKLIERGAVLKRVRIDAELKGEVARASETARARRGKEAADLARQQKAQELGLPIKEGRVEIPDAQLEYEIDGPQRARECRGRHRALQRQEYRRESGGRFRRAWKHEPRFAADRPGPWPGR